MAVEILRGFGYSKEEKNRCDISIDWVHFCLSDEVIP